MNDSEIEQKLARFKLKNTPEAARTRVLTAARAAWQLTPQTESFWTWNTWRWPACYAAAAALLLLLNGIVTGLDERRISAILTEQAPTLNNTPTAIKQLYAELGRDPAVARQLRMLAARSAPRGDINDLMRRKNKLLQATELL